MKPYSIKFRQKIIEVYKQGNVSIRKLAQRFCVAPSFIQKLLKQYKETRNIHPRPPGRSPAPKLKEEQLLDLIEIIETHFDQTSRLNLVETIPTIQISIGRIEVRASQPPTPPSRTKSAQRGPTQSLQDYLKQHHEGRS